MGLKIFYFWKIFEFYTWFAPGYCISHDSHSIDICTVEIKNIRNMHAISANQIADIFHFNDNW